MTCVADRVHQVGLAEADAAVQEERVVGVARALRHRQAGRVGQAVGRPDDEVREGVARVDGRPARPRRRPGSARRGPAGTRPAAAGVRRVAPGPSAGGARPRAMPPRRTRPGRCSRRSAPASGRSASGSGSRASPWRSRWGRRSGSAGHRRRRAACRAATSRSWRATATPGARRARRARPASRPFVDRDLCTCGPWMGSAGQGPKRKPGALERCSRWPRRLRCCVPGTRIVRGPRVSRGVPAPKGSERIAPAVGAVARRFRNTPWGVSVRGRVRTAPAPGPGGARLGDRRPGGRDVRRV